MISTDLSLKSDYFLSFPFYYAHSVNFFISGVIFSSSKISNWLFFFNLFILFIFGCVWVFVAACRLSLVAVSGGYSSLQ